MRHTAKVDSIDALRSFQSDLRTFEIVARDAVATLEKEARRGLHWLEQDRTRHWPQQIRIRSDELNEARVRLQIGKMQKVADHEPACDEEKEAHEIARRRLREAEEKVTVVRRWCHTIGREVHNCEARIGQLAAWLDCELPKALATLEHMSQALSEYVQVTPPEIAGNHDPRVSPMRSQDTGSSEADADE